MKFKAPRFLPPYRSRHRTFKPPPDSLRQDFQAHDYVRLPELDQVDIVDAGLRSGRIASVPWKETEKELWQQPSSTISGKIRAWLSRKRR